MYQQFKFGLPVPWCSNTCTSNIKRCAAANLFPVWMFYIFIVDCSNVATASRHMRHAYEMEFIIWRNVVYNIKLWQQQISAMFDMVPPFKIFLKCPTYAYRPAIDWFNKQVTVIVFSVVVSLTSNRTRIVAKTIVESNQSTTIEIYEGVK